MTRRITWSLATAILVAMLVGLIAPLALAHEERGVGDFDFTVGFGAEPAYLGQPNSVLLLLARGGEPVVDLGDTLDVEVSFGDADPLQLTLEPFFEEGEFGTPGDYRAWFIPTSVGAYTVHFSGTIDGQDVDETFTSSSQTFDDVVSTDAIQYPEKVPSAGDLADRIDRVEPRLTTAIEDARTAAVAQARAASKDAKSARTLGAIGIVVGVLGLLGAGAALVLVRRKTA